MSAGSLADGASVKAPTTEITLVVGLGNPLLADDGVGWRVADALIAHLAAFAADVADAAQVAGSPPAGDSALANVLANVEVDRLAVGGLTLVERLVGYRRAILVDAMVTGEHPPGTVHRYSVADFPGYEATHLDSAHDASLATALATGRSLGADLPTEIAIVAIEAVRVAEFGEEMTPAVEAAIPVALAAVLAAIGEVSADDAPAIGDVVTPSGELAGGAGDEEAT
jgi:hydrogenase maturation protease